MLTEAAKLTLVVDAGQDADAEQLDRATRQLLEELREQPVESAEIKEGGPAPDGTKGVDAGLLGALAVSVLPEALPPLVGFLKDWAARGKSGGRSVKIKLEQGGQKIEMEYDPATMTSEQLAMLMAALAGRGSSGQTTQGGVALNNSGQMRVGGDVVGRDNIQAGGHVIHAEPGATVIINPPLEKN